MSKHWPYETIRELLLKAEAEGEARAELESPREAELFRFAIYNFRKNVDEDIGRDITIALQDNIVILTRVVVSPVTIL